MTSPIPRDIETAKEDVRVAYTRGYQDGYRACHEERAAVKGQSDARDMLRRIEELEHQVKALQGDAADRAKLVGDLSTTVRQNEAILRDHLDGV